jgi:hypothetical protein
MTDEVAVLKAALLVVSNALDALVDECLADGEPKPPSKRELMKARAMLPPHCKHALTKVNGAKAPK